MVAPKGHQKGFIKVIRSRHATRQESLGLYHIFLFNMYLLPETKLRRTNFLPKTCSVFHLYLLDTETRELNFLEARSFILGSGGLGSNCRGERDWERYTGWCVPEVGYERNTGTTKAFTPARLEISISKEFTTPPQEAWEAAFSTYTADLISDFYFFNIDEA